MCVAPMASDFADQADMITSQRPLFSRGISIPKEMTQLSVEAFTAGIVEAALEGLGFVRTRMDGSS